MRYQIYNCCNCKKFDNLINHTHSVCQCDHQVGGHFTIHHESILASVTAHAVTVSPSLLAAFTPASCYSELFLQQDSDLGLGCSPWQRHPELLLQRSKVGLLIRVLIASDGRRRFNQLVCKQGYAVCPVFNIRQWEYLLVRTI